ncbi:hypothetical protein AB0D13_00110 [Streptomyces sp. NPDC048430]|uniref:hypothetical protein n=1 Tax=Streptomyces sp. NPDC048430 TaxID=3155388 RepID=UPI00344872FB
MRVRLIEGGSLPAGALYVERLAADAVRPGFTAAPATDGAGPWRSTSWPSPHKRAAAHL